MELEFRVFDGKEMIYDGIGITENGCGISEYTHCGSCGTDYTYYEPKNVMQYIGLKDKKEKKVYTGDILGKEKEGKDWERAIVRYDEKLSKFVLDFYSEYGGEGYSGRGEYICDWLKSGYVVIGNIHENKDKIC